MNTLRNSVQLIGHLGADPEVKTLEKGVKLTRIRIATNDAYKAADGSFKEETIWHNIVGWGNIADKMEKNLHKGSFLLVEGKLTYREFTDQSGAKKYYTEIRASNLIILDKKIPDAQGLPVAATVLDHQEEGLPF